MGHTKCCWTYVLHMAQADQINVRQILQCMCQMTLDARYWLCCAGLVRMCAVLYIFAWLSASEQVYNEADLPLTSEINFYRKKIVIFKYPGVN
jgi:hypothetical protein